MEHCREILAIFSSDNENKMCFDCQKPYPQFTSINNGIFICEDCSLIHKTLSSNISFVKSIKDEWDEYLLSFMSRGGNRRLRLLMQNYDLIFGADIAFKYKTNAVEYYRQVVNMNFILDKI